MGAMELAKMGLRDALASNLKAYYRMESGALTTDSSGNGYTLTNNGSVAETTGKFGICADFGTGNNSKSLTNADNTGVDGGVCSIVAWIKLSTEIASDFYAIVSQQSSGTKVKNAIVYNYNGGTRRLEFWRVRNGVAVDGPTYNVTLGTSEWYHIAFTYDGATVCGYLNGRLVGSSGSSGNGSSASSSFFNIGRDDSGIRYFSGLADDVAFFNTVLSADQIKELYEGRTVGELWPQLFSAELNNSYLKNSSLKVYYRFEESSGTTLSDSSGTGNNGTASRSNILNNAGGKYGKKATFVRTSSDRVTISSPTGIPTGSSAFTVAGWIKPSAYDDAMTVYGWGTGGTGLANAFRLKSSGGNGVIHFFWNKDLSVNVSGLTDGNFHHFAVTYGGGGQARRIYIDGSQVATDTPTGVNVSSSDIAVGGFSADYFNGDIDDFAIWNVELTASQIAQLYSQTNGLQGLWHLNGNSNDFSGNNYHLTNNGSTTFTSGKFGQAGSFNGSSQSLSIVNASCPNLNIVGSQTWMCWFNSNVNNADKAILSKHDGTNYRSIQIGPSAQVIGYLSGLTTNSSVSTPNSLIQTGKWYFLAWIYDQSASKLKLWVNMNKYEATASGVSASNSGDFRIGNDRTQWYFNGLIDEVAIYNRALSDQEIRNYYSWATGRFSNII